MISNKNWGQGLIVGKFYPPHKGHHFLINTGIKHTKNLTVVVCELSGEKISGSLRADWIKAVHPDINVLVKNCDNIDPKPPDVWARLAVEWLGKKPDVVFTSERYGDPWAQVIGCHHMLVDLERTVFPISGSICRADPLGHFKYLEEPVKAYFVKRIVILGAESSGTTTLAKELAQSLHTAWVPEYGHLYCQARQYQKSSGTKKHYIPWTTSDFVHIATTQNYIEDHLAAKANKILICDTNSYATHVWHRRYMGYYSKSVRSLSVGHNYDLHILTDIDIPFVQDGTRDGENIRSWMHQEFINKLKKDKKNYLIVSGSPEERLATALDAIRKLPKTGM